jgi:hypothetical protein
MITVFGMNMILFLVEFLKRMIMITIFPMYMIQLINRFIKGILQFGQVMLAFICMFVRVGYLLLFL